MRVFVLLFCLIIIFGCAREMEQITEPDITPPSPPQGVYIYFAGDGMIILVWEKNKESDFAFYKIYRSTDSLNFSFISQTSENIFGDKDLDYDTTYYYYITAVDNSGNESEPSVIVGAKPLNLYPPVQPYGLTVEAHNDPDGIYINLSWYKNPDGDIKLYKIFRSKTPNFTTHDSNLVGTSTINFYRDTLNLSLNQHYYYKIVAIDKGGLQSKPSYEEDDIILKQPELIKPENNAITSYDLTFKWKKVEHASGYVIFISTSRFGNEIWKRVVYSESSNDTISVSYTGSSLYSGKTYFWKVATFTKGENIINSISETRSFTVILR